jgi:Circadian oscillating protein COP23
MNIKQFWMTIGTAPLFAVGVVVSLMQPSKAAAQTVNITCQANNSTPTVIATVTELNNVKDFTLLNFPSQYFVQQDAMENCQNTAKTLQSLYDTNSANYLTGDKVNTQPVICVVERRGIGCNHDNARVLFTLNSTANPSQVLYEMLGSNFKQAQPPNSRTVSRIYSDIRRKTWWPW